MRNLLVLLDLQGFENLAGRVVLEQVFVTGFPARFFSTLVGMIRIADYKKTYKVLKTLQVEGM